MFIDFRLRFGSNNLFVFIHPDQAAQLKKKDKVLRDITFEYAQNEIAKNSGFNIAEGLSYIYYSCFFFNFEIKSVFS